MLSERTLQLVLLLKEIIRFYDKLQGNGRNLLEFIEINLQTNYV